MMAGQCAMILAPAVMGQLSKVKDFVPFYTTVVGGSIVLLAMLFVLSRPGGSKAGRMTKEEWDKMKEEMAKEVEMEEKKGEEEDYLPQNDEFIPPTNFAVIENGLYRSTCIPSLSYPGAFPVKRNFAFLRHLGIRSILFALLRVLTPSVLVPEEYPEDSLKFLKRCNIRLFKYPLEGNKVAL